MNKLISNNLDIIYISMYVKLQTCSTCNQYIGDTQAWLTYIVNILIKYLLDTFEETNK